MHVRAKLPSTRDRVQRALLAPAAFDSELLTPVPYLYYLALRICFHLTFITSCKRYAGPSSSPQHLPFAEAAYAR